MTQLEQLEQQAITQIKDAMLAEVAAMPPERRMNDIAGCVADAAAKVGAEIEAQNPRGTARNMWTAMIDAMLEEG